MVTSSVVNTDVTSSDAFLNRMPCEPANIIAITKILAEDDPSLHSLGPFFEQDLILSLKVISAANEMMKGRSSRAIAVRNVPHALSIIGFNGVSDIVESSLVSDSTDQAALHFQVYRFTLAQTQFLLRLIQNFASYYPSLNVDDIRLYVSVFALSQLRIAQENPIVSNILFFLYQREPVNFWDAEMELLETTLIDSAVRLTQYYCLPREVHDALDVMPGLEQFFYSGTGLKLKKIHGFFKKKKREQDIVLPVIVLCYILVHRSPLFWGDKQTQFMIHWLSRFLNRQVSDVWYLVQREFLRGAKTYPILDSVGRSLMAQHWPCALQSTDLERCLESYKKRAGIDQPSAMLSLDEAKKKPAVKSLVQTEMLALAPDETLAVESKENTGPVRKKTAKQEVREPGEGIAQFMAILRSNPNAYGSKLPAASALLETLRIGLSVEFCLAIFYDEKKTNFWVGSVSGLASRHPIRNWTVQKEGAGLLLNFLAKPAGVWVQGERRAPLLKALPKMLVNIIGHQREAFIGTTINAKKVPTGVVIAVAREDDTLSKSCYQAFQKATLSVPL